MQANPIHFLPSFALKDENYFSAFNLWCIDQEQEVQNRKEYLKKERSFEEKIFSEGISKN
jgi:hypothetical protein